MVSHRAACVTALAGMFLLGNGCFASDIGRWHGYLIDRQCAESVKGDSDPMPFILNHTKDCLVMANCKAKGYSLYAGGKWFDLDKRSNELAEKVVPASKKKRGFYVEITGTLDGKVLKAKSMKEIEEPKPSSGTEIEHGSD